MYRSLRKALKDNDHPLVAIVLPVVIALVGLLVRNLALASPIMSGDEYAYYAESRVIRHIPALAARDPLLQLVGNPVFLLIGKLFFAISNSPEDLMKAFNALAFAVSVLLACLIMYRLSERKTPLYAPLIISLLPFSAYSAYFMPETLYVLIFVCIATTLIIFLPANPPLGMCLAGFLVGALLLTKSHGAAILVAVFLTLVSMLALPGKLHPNWRRVLVSTGLFVLSTYISEVALNGIIIGKFSWSPLLFIGGYMTYVKNSIDASTLTRLLFPVGRYVAGHLIIFAFISILPVACFVGGVLSMFRASGSLDQRQLLDFRRIYVLVAFTLLATVVSMVMTINFALYVGSITPTELVRIPGRYYAFVLLLYLPGFFVLQHQKALAIRPPGGWRLWGLLGLAAALSMFWVRRAFNLYPWDYPEIFSTSLQDGSKFLSLPIIIMGVIFYGIVSIKPKLQWVLYPLFVFCLFTASQYRVIAWQFGQAEAYGPPAIQGRALRDLIPEAERSRGTIIGDDRYGKMANFLFGFSSDAWVRVLPQGDTITLDELPPGTDWVILLGKYDVNIPIRSSFSAPDAWLGWLTPSLPVVHERLDFWDGKPLVFEFRIGANTDMLEQFNPPEKWGAWSATDGSQIILPTMISGKVKIETIGWINSQSSGELLNLVLGNVSVPVQMGPLKGQSCEVVDLPAPVQIITLRGISPVKPKPQSMPKAVALAELRIERVNDILGSVSCPAFVPLN